MSEIQLQAACFKWAWNTFPETRYLFFSVPNEGNRSLILSQQLKASGLISGIPDMILIRKYSTFGFEFKDGKKGKTSKNQDKVHEVWAENGLNVYIIRNFTEFQGIFTEIMNYER